MSDPIDDDLRARLERLALAVPVRSTPRLQRVEAPRPRSRGLATISGLGVLVVGVVVFMVAVARLAGGMPGTRIASPSSSQSAIPTAAPVVPVAGSANDGTFRLDIRADANSYAPNDPIAVSATLTYLGPAATFTVGSSSDIVNFGVEEIGGNRRVDPAWRLDCTPVTYKQDQGVDYPFVKSGGYDPNNPKDAFVGQYLNIVNNELDPVLRLPTGVWRIFATTDLMDGTCPGAEHRLTASVTVAVGGAIAPPAASATPMPSAPSHVPQPSGPAFSSPVASPTLPPPDVALPYPDGCAAYSLSPRRCAYIVDWAKQQAGYAPDESLSVSLLGDPDCHATNPDACGAIRTTWFVVRVRLAAQGGSSVDESAFCGFPGSRNEYSLLCWEHPQIKITSPTMNGYRDVPCSSENGPCATPLPGPDPDAVKASSPLRIPSLDIPIDHAGAYSLDLGEAVLPNGLLTEASLQLADDAPTNMLVNPDGMNLAIMSLDGGPPFENAYVRGWHAGTERVSVTLTFTVDSFDPGAELQVRDLVVR